MPSHLTSFKNVIVIKQSNMSGVGAGVAAAPIGVSADAALIDDLGCYDNTKSPEIRAREYAEGIRRKNQRAPMKPVEGTAATIFEFIEA